MAVEITRALKAALDSLKAALLATNPALARTVGWERVVADFERWKTAQGEYGSFFFGKDGGYTTPKVGGKPYVLRHAHMVPMSDQRKLHFWKKAWRDRSRKTSNRILVYCQDGRDFILIYILSEPDAHKIADMTTAADKQTMYEFARVAEAFIERREIIG